MTATYDGKLIVTKEEIFACCRTMDIFVIHERIFLSSRGKMVLQSPVSGLLGEVIVCCPFCGAKPEGSA